MYLPDRDESGRLLIRPASTTSGWSFQACSFEFETCVLNSDYCKDMYDVTVPSINLTFYDSADTQLTTQTDIDANCVKTIFDIELQHDFDVIGGDLSQKTTPAGDIRLWCIAVPRIPANSGGEKEMIRGLNLAYLAGPGAISYDGKSALRMKYDAALHSNEMRFLLRHPVGFKHNLMGTLEFFKA